MVRREYTYIYGGIHTHPNYHSPCIFLLAFSSIKLIALIFLLCGKLKRIRKKTIIPFQNHIFCANISKRNISVVMLLQTVVRKRYYWTIFGKGDYKRHKSLKVLSIEMRYLVQLLAIRKPNCQYSAHSFSYII
jgi:hypothetical protein